MNILVLEHVPFENEGRIAEWAQQRGHTLSRCRLHAGDVLPDPESFDMLAIMGGPMNIYEYEAYPWLLDEQGFIARAIDAGKYAVGICLGAQLLCHALGGRVTRNPEREVGWHNIEWCDELWNTSCSVAFHWHGDMFSIPPGAQRIARSEACENQAFVFEHRILGLQCHFDYFESSIEGMLEHCGAELQPSGKFVQSAEEIRQRLAESAILGRQLFKTMDRLIAGGNNE